MKNPNLLADALYNLCVRSGASDDYAKGLVVGAMSALMAETGKDYGELVPILAELMPARFDPIRLPGAWRADFLPLIR